MTTEFVIAIVVGVVFIGFLAWRISRPKVQSTSTGGDGKDTPPKQHP